MSSHSATFAQYLQHPWRFATFDNDEERAQLPDAIREGWYWARHVALHGEAALFLSGELMTGGVLRVPEGHSAEHPSDIIDFPHLGDDRLLGANWVTVGFAMGIVMAETCPEAELFDVYPAPSLRQESLDYLTAWGVGADLHRFFDEVTLVQLRGDVEEAVATSSSLPSDHDLNAHLFENNYRALHRCDDAPMLLEAILEGMTAGPDDQPDLNRK